MALEQKKRKRPAPTSSQRSKKRQRVQPVTTTNVPSDVKKLPVALDALPWNEVEMPDMFEDAEGFFGLEEVDDVEVVRDGNRVQFVGLPGHLICIEEHILTRDSYLPNPKQITMRMSLKDLETMRTAPLGKKRKAKLEQL
jgi:ATP-dependent RNA helicase DDX24/MAK5